MGLPTAQRIQTVRKLIQQQLMWLRYVMPTSTGLFFLCTGKWLAPPGYSRRAADSSPWPRCGVVDLRPRSHGSEPGSSPFPPDIRHTMRPAYPTARHVAHRLQNCPLPAMLPTACLCCWCLQPATTRPWACLLGVHVGTMAHHRCHGMHPASPLLPMQSGKPSGSA
jgi:hypothetical protein